jgi:predicted negative regulator of RcsB-dependent stress response
MTQLATAVIAGVAMLFGYRLLQKHAESQTQAVRAKAARDQKSARDQTGRVQKDLGALVWDERSGVYRPRG